MSDKKSLKVIATESKKNSSISDTSRSWRQETEGYFERAFLLDKERFHPDTIIEKERVQRTLDLIYKTFNSLDNKQVVDLGCGFGVIAEKIAQKNAHLTVLDIAENALKEAKTRLPSNVTYVKQCLPHTTLEDDAYDLVISTDVISYLPTKQLRLYMAECCRLVKPTGYFVCSTELDYKTLDPLMRFASLADTEFKIEDWILSYHRLFIAIQGFLKAPQVFKAYYDNPPLRQFLLQDRSGFNKTWFEINSKGFLGGFWKGISVITRPLANCFSDSKTCMKFLEVLSRIIYGDQGISHAIFIGQRRPLAGLHLDKEEMPVDRKGKREIWT